MSEMEKTKLHRTFPKIIYFLVFFNIEPTKRDVMS